MAIEHFIQNINISAKKANNIQNVLERFNVLIEKSPILTSSWLF